MIKAVFIDIDNTILSFDEAVREAMICGFEKYSLCIYEDYMFDVFRKVNDRMWREIEQGLLTYEELYKTRWNEIFGELNISFDGEIFEKYFRSFLSESAIPVEGAKEIIEYLSEKYILCAASNGPYAQQINRLKKAGMFSYFSHFFISEKIGHSKPSAEFFSHCLNEINVPPSQIIIIGDSLTSDIAGGIENGLKTCYFDINATKNTRGMAIDFVVENLDEIRLFL